jgi:AraC-like DNA-binding protein
VALLKTARAGVTETYLPKAPLRNFVDSISRYDGALQPHDLERVLPTGTMRIIIHLAEDTSLRYDPRDPRLVGTHRDAIVSGAHRGYFLIDTAEQTLVFGVSFKPGGAAPFLRMPARELRDLNVSLEDAIGREALGLREHLLEVTPGERFAFLESWLIEQARSDLTIHPAVRYALTEFRAVPHARSVSEVIDHVGLSSRHFTELFEEQVGLTPKLFCRIQRFQHAIKLAQESDGVDWADIAAIAGYYDQSHMIRDFQEFSGLSPGAYLRQRGPHLNHVPLPA